MFKPTSPEKIRSWEEKILQQQKSGLSIQRWCNENQVVVCQFHYWKSRLFPKQINTSSFTELVETKNGGVTLEYDGVRIHLDPNFDAITLKRCLSVVREGKC
jgi:predicted methyltransferase